MEDGYRCRGWDLSSSLSITIDGHTKREGIKPRITYPKVEMTPEGGTLVG
jgi:hypothetical protein